VEERDSFNIPIYFRTQEEIMCAIDRCGGFKMENMVNLKIADEMNPTDQTPNCVQNPASYGKHRAMMARNAIGGFIETYFGEDKIVESDETDEKKPLKSDILFEQYASIAANDTELINKACFTQVIAVSVTRVWNSDILTPKINYI